jgi:hypothetical protein
MIASDPAAPDEPCLTCSDEGVIPIFHFRSGEQLGEIACPRCGGASHGALRAVPASALGYDHFHDFSRGRS